MRTSQREREDEVGRLLPSARAGDADALGELLLGFREYLLAIAQDELKRAVRAKLGPSDVVQDTFLRARQRFGDFAGSTDAELKAWLQEILRNRCRDLHDAHLGAAKRDARREVALEAAGSANSPVAALAVDTQTPSQHAVADEDARLLMLALEHLPEDMRRVVWLRNWESLPFDEIGQKMGRSAEAVRKLFTRAVRRLGDELEQADGQLSADG